MGEKPPLKDKSITHTMCPECAAKWDSAKDKTTVMKGVDLNAGFDKVSNKRNRVRARTKNNQRHKKDNPRTKITLSDYEDRGDCLAGTD